MPNVVLPRTGIQVRVPLVLYTLAVDGSPQDRGIVPDIPVVPTIEDLLARRDVVMERALRFLATRAR
jgi:C-terminal processing protease CtpA/Prc